MNLYRIRCLLSIVFFSACQASLFAQSGPPDLWSTSSAGGIGGGSIFKINPDGTNLTQIKIFNNDPKGSEPQGIHLIKGTDGDFYGVTTKGGSHNSGVIFKIRGSDKGYEKIFDFDEDGVATGKFPWGSLTQASNGALYGMTNAGGSLGQGVIFKINTNGTGFVKLIDFDVSTKGNSPIVNSNLIQASDGYLYGIAPQGGANGFGVIFKIDLNGAYQKILDFDNVTSGSFPIGSLTQGSDGKLYGLTRRNNVNYGTIFRVETNGTGYTTLYEFTDINNGDRLVGALLEGNGGYLFGATSDGGTSNNGVIFKLKKDGTAFEKLFDFQNFNTGGFPHSGLVVGDDSRLYGATSTGGNSGNGTVFSFASDGTDFQKEADLDGLSGWMILGSLTPVDGRNLMALCYQGGLGKGTALNLNVIDGVVTKVVDLYSANDGQLLQGALQMNDPILQTSSGYIFGTAMGGEFNKGVLFKIKPDGTSYTKLVDFDGSNGQGPGKIIEATDGWIYGMCSTGGVNDYGTIFKIRQDGSGFAKIFDFSYGNSGGPFTGNSFLQLANGDLLGETSRGGINGWGTIFKIKRDGSGYTKLVDFVGTNGINPLGTLVQDNGGNFYGTTAGGGTSNFGLIFKLDQNGENIQTLYQFTQNTYAHALTLSSSDVLMGLTSFVGSNNQGSIFKIKTDGTSYQTVYNFNVTTGPSSGIYPFSNFSKEIGGFVFSLTSSNGQTQRPALFKIKNDGTGFQQILNFPANAGVAGEPGTPLVVLHKQFQQIAFDPLNDKTFGDAPFNLSSTATSGLTTTYISSDPSVATITGNVVTLVGAGTTDIIAKQGGNSTYFAAPDVIRSLTVAPNQTITFNSLPLFTIGDAPFTISTSAAFASSGLPLTFTSSNTLVATISGNVVTWVGAGTITITATQSGNVNFSAASAQQAVTVRPIPTVVITSKATGSFGSTIKLVTNKGGSTGEVTYSVSNGTGSATVTGDVLSLTGVGTVTITANVAADNNYGQGVNTQQITITKGNPVVQLLSPSNCLVGTNLTLSVDKGGSTGAVTYSLLGGTGTATLSGTSLTATSSGTQIIRAVVLSDANYNEGETIQTIIIQPTSSATPNSAQFWGVASGGGVNNAGVIYKTNSDGTGLSVQHEFTTSSTGYPYVWAEMMPASNGKMYGVAAGGIFNQGVLFEFDPASATYSKLHDFFGVNGVNPTGRLAEASNGKLYGTTGSGGVNGNGILFEFDLQTKTFAKKFDFTKSTSGANPEGLIAAVSGSKLYGTSSNGGSYNAGTLFEYDPSQNSFVTKINFSSQNGIYPTGELLLAASGKVYGLLKVGGQNNAGVLYEFNPSDDSFVKLHDFSNQESGGYLTGTLSQALNGNLYGSIQFGGQFYGGFIFEFILNTNTYSKKFDLSYTTGTTPSRMTIGANGNLYGTTAGGGGIQGVGVIFEYNPNGNTYTKKIEFDIPTNGSFPGAVTLAPSGKFYGLTSNGGELRKGTIFEYNPTSNVCVSKFSFSYAPGGASPRGTLTPSEDGRLYGVSTGGERNQGVLFEYDRITNTYLKKHDFIDPLEGKDPVGSLLLTDTKKIIGLAMGGGAKGDGVIYEYDLISNEFAKKIDLDVSTIGGLPNGGLMKASNGKLYGVASGGLNFRGTLFELDPLTYQLTKKFDFETSANGCGPTGSLVEAPNHKLYGVTSSCGANNVGVLFEYDYSTNLFRKIIDFDGSLLGSYPVGGLVLAPDGLLYGNASGGVNNNGVLFSYNPVTESFSKLFDFSYNVSGSQPQGTMAVGSGGKLYGLTNIGGSVIPGGGVLFELDPVTKIVTKKLDLSASTGQYPTGSLTLIKANQIISFSPILAKAFNDVPFDLTATSTSGLQVTYVSSNPNVATISNGKVTIVGIGSTTITASQSGDFDYNPALQVQQILVVNKANQTISFDVLSSRNPGDPSFALLATTTSGLTISYTSSDETVATISGNTVTIIGPGSTIITAKQTGNANYNAATDVTQTLIINKTSQTITFNSLAAKTFSDVPFVLSATATSGLPVSYTSSDETIATTSGNTVTIAGAGSVTITAKQAGNSNYDAATDATQVLTVSKADQAITFAAISSKTFGQVPFNLTATSTSGLTIQYTNTSDKVSLSGNQVALIKPGSVSIKAEQSGDTNFNAAASVSQSFCINPAKPTITTTGLNSDSPILTSSSSTGNQWYKNGSLIAGAVSSTLTPTSEGSYTVRVTVDNCSSEVSTEQILIITADQSPVLPTGFFVYPNPVDATLTIDVTAFDSNSDVHIVIYDVLGREMERISKRGAKAIVSVVAFPQGTYFIKASQGTLIHKAKFAKE